MLNLKMVTIVACCFLLISLILTGCASQQLQMGANAFNQGKYDVAASHWNPLAKNGNPYAQYNLGLLWEGGLGRTPKNINEASQWYLKSAKQGYVPAMVRLANIQQANGYSEAANSWYVLAARWGNQDAISALSAWGKTIPQADLLQQKQTRDAIAQQQATEALGKAAYSLGCALGGGGCASGYAQPSVPSYSPSVSVHSDSPVVKDPCNCKGYDGPGGPCYSGPGGPAYDGPGGPAYSGPGGPCYAGPGGAEYSGPGGPAYDGPGGQRYSGPGGPSYDGPGGPAYDGPGGPCYAGPGGPCYSGPGGTAANCPRVCR